MKQRTARLKYQGDFNLQATLKSGQVFGFRQSQSQHSGFIGKAFVELWQEGHNLCWSGPMPKQDLISYFDLHYDLTPIYKCLEGQALTRIVSPGSPLYSIRGLRLIRQDSWQALACFIISSNNNIKRIEHIYREIFTYFHGFPSPADIALSHERILKQLGLGYRAAYLMDSARFLANNDVILNAIRDMEYEKARELVSCFPGIGPKVADCVLLYGFHKLEAFPLDVWMLRLMKKIFFKNRNVSPEKIHAFALKKWADKAGYVQQYLFHGGRMGLI